MRSLIKNYSEIFLLSVLMLFVELMLIRWVSTEINIFAYLQNTVLVVCFLGLGFGFLSAKREVSASRSVLYLLIVVTLISVPGFRQVTGLLTFLLTALNDMVVWGRPIFGSLFDQLLAISSGIVLAYFFLRLIVHLFVPIGQRLGFAMDSAPNIIVAYSVNVFASLVGILLFAGISALNLPPIAWVLISCLLLYYFLHRTGEVTKRNIVFLFLLIVAGASSSFDPTYFEVRWSPYQKLALGKIDYAEGSQSTELSYFQAAIKKRPTRPSYPEERYLVRVNNTGYQAIIDLQENTITDHPEIFPPKFNGISHYDVPALLHPDPKEMLIVGTGTGNDVAGALRQGAKNVVAVEIDPLIIDFGKRLHPEKPYQAENVTVVNDDARSYFSSTKKKFDVIAFGLLDSHTTTSMTNARLDHYVYTLESLKRVSKLLTEDGIVTLIFEAQKPFIADRISKALTEIFGERPLTTVIPYSGYSWGGVMFIAGNTDLAKSQIAQNSALSEAFEHWKAERPISSLPHETQVTTDDWPYLYLEHRQIPILCYLLAALLCTLAWKDGKRWGLTGVGGNWSKTDLHFFFLGAAFMLLEVQNISKASVVFGNTWQVNAVIISGILFMVLLANLVVHFFPKVPRTIVLLALVGVSIALFFVDIAQFSSLEYLQRTVVVSCLTTLPMFFSGIVFITSLQQAPNIPRALGINLIGSLVGAILQSVTFIIGIQALMLIVAALYTAAGLTAPKEATAS